jgi:hypothetical protein
MRDAARDKGRGRRLTAGFRGRRRRRRHHFFGAAFDLSCFGFLFFLSFFCALLPLAMMQALP